MNKNIFKKLKRGTICDSKNEMDNDVIKANIFNTFFSTVADRFQCSTAPPMHPYIIPCIPNNEYTLFWSPVSDDGVYYTIK